MKKSDKKNVGLRALKKSTKSKALPFSVLIPIYKKEKPEYFDDALKSIFSQTVLPNEVVICEDGLLTKELDKIVNKYKRKYPKILKIVKFKENRGLGRTLRDGVLKCSNEIIFRADSDDISLPNRFEKQLEFLKENNIDVIGSTISEFDEKMEKHTGDRIVPERNRDIVIFAERRNPINHMSVGFKKSKVLAAGNYQDMPGFEDYFLWVRMLMMGCEFYNLQGPLVKVRGGSSMIRRRGGRKYTNSLIKFERTIYKRGFITRIELFENIFLRSIASFSPNFIREKFYQKTLRGRA
ncbi:glycosyltransferase [Candidatus Saccharibacteria bacterium]|nr:glycosyltransferase [Candidatus Saccharibacteria bacterium]